MDPAEEDPTGESELSATKRTTIVAPPEISGERRASVDVAVDPAKRTTIVTPPPEAFDSSAYDARISDFVMPPEQKCHPEDEDLGGASEEEEEAGYPYTQCTFPPEEQMATDKLVVKFHHRSDEYPGEVDDFNLGDDQNSDRELSTLSATSLDEIIRMLQGLDKDGTGNTELLADVNSSTLQDTSGEMATSPKMQRFQEALRRHLERQMYQETIETRVAEHELKMLRREREEIGQHLYNLQFELARQSDHMGNLDTQLDHLHKQRAEHDAAGEILEREMYVVKDNLRMEIEIDKKMIQAIKEMDMMEWCIRQTDQEYGGEAKIPGQLDEQFKRAKTKTELEKRNQDFYLDKVLTHVQRMEHMNAEIQRQIQAHLDEPRDLNSSINEAGTLMVVRLKTDLLKTNTGIAQAWWENYDAKIRKCMLQGGGGRGHRGGNRAARRRPNYQQLGNNARAAQAPIPNAQGVPMREPLRRASQARIPIAYVLILGVWMNESSAPTSTTRTNYYTRPTIHMVWATLSRNRPHYDALLQGQKTESFNLYSLSAFISVHNMLQRRRLPQDYSPAAAVYILHSMLVMPFREFIGTLSHADTVYYTNSHVNYLRFIASRCGGWMKGFYTYYKAIQPTTNLYRTIVEAPLRVNEDGHLLDMPNPNYPDNADPPVEPIRIGWPMDWCDPLLLPPPQPMQLG